MLKAATVSSDTGDMLISVCGVNLRSGQLLHVAPLMLSLVKVELIFTALYRLLKVV